LSLSGIEGLETIIGDRYIAVSPGTIERAGQRQFTGLATAPPDELAGEGLKLLLQVDTRSGLNPGAPVTWRGVEVGQVLSVALSADARHVNASVRIRGNYRRLVKVGSKFWVTKVLGDQRSGCPTVWVSM